MANSIKIDIRGDDKLMQLLDSLPKLVVSPGGPLDKAIKSAAKIVESRAKTLAPDSRATGSREKQSKKSKAIWTGKLNRLVRSKILKYPTATWAVVGPRSPEGNMASFMQEKPRVHVLWGKASSLKRYRITRDWISRAYDETRSEQLSAIEASLRQSIDANMKGLKG